MDRLRETTFFRNILLVVFFYVLTSCAFSNSVMSEHHQNKETVVLLHGILRSKLDMYPLKKFFEGHGYQTINIQYPSRKMSLQELSTFVHNKIIATPEYNQNTQLHFVTHSMGGLLARYYIDHYKPENLGKVVMLGPPNTGSEFADWLSDAKILSPLFKAIYGPAGQQLRTDYAHKDTIDYPLGVIAGNASIMPLAPWILVDMDHDGVVPVHRTKIEGMTDHIIIYSTHTLMMFNHEVMEQTLNFLKSGKFDHKKQES